MPTAAADGGHAAMNGGGGGRRTATRDGGAPGATDAQPPAKLSSRKAIASRIGAAWRMDGLLVSIDRRRDRRCDRGARSAKGVSADAGSLGGAETCWTYPPRPARITRISKHETRV